MAPSEKMELQYLVILCRGFGYSKQALDWDMEQKFVEDEIAHVLDEDMVCDMKQELAKNEIVQVFDGNMVCNVEQKRIEDKIVL